MKKIIYLGMLCLFSLSLLNVQSASFKSSDKKSECAAFAASVAHELVHYGVHPDVAEQYARIAYEKCMNSQ